MLEFLWGQFTVVNIQINSGSWKTEFPKSVSLCDFSSKEKYEIKYLEWVQSQKMLTNLNLYIICSEIIYTINYAIL